MIQPNELRIGNYILAEVKDWTEGRVVAITGAGDVFMDLDSVPYQIEDVRPIPLTSEWLEKFGFESEDDGQNRPRYIIGDLMGLNYSFGAWYWRFNDLQDKSHVELRYVHQLQNLYFALTGEELTIKDDGKKEGKEQQESSRAESPATDSLE